MDKLIDNANGSFCKNFVSLFKKTASLFSRKKISIEWMLNFVVQEEMHHSRILDRIHILVDIYLKHNDLFIDDVDSIEWKTELMKQTNLSCTST